MKNAHLLLVEDETDAGRLLADYLELHGFQVTWLADGQAALTAIAQPPSPPWALALLDVMLPGASGYALLEALRAQPATQEMPVLMLTAQDSEQDVVRGLSAGADGYIRKPTGFAEVLAHVQALLRRHQPPTQSLQLGSLILDPSLQRARLPEGEIPLTPTEFRLLHMLARQPRRIFTREELADALGAEEDKLIGIRTIDAHIKNLRAKLGAHAPLIATQRGLGYGINPELL